jgi:hypothetical protein
MNKMFARENVFCGHKYIPEDLNFLTTNVIPGLVREPANATEQI